MEDTVIKDIKESSCQRNKSHLKNLIGKSAEMEKVQQEILQVADCNANVLILGESGTGKEVVARSIHCLSKRYNKNFVPINCGAIPPDLLESELFGHEKGAFTGAITSRQGRFSMAEGGTLFLDEIGEMPMAMQVKLLRVLEERVFERVGGTATITSNVRIVAATNRNLEDMVKQGKFREDLYFRLDVFPIKLPALRDRIIDLPLLTDYLIKRLKHSKRHSVHFSKNALIAMSKYDWPGNVRELANLIERMSIQHPNALVEENQLPARISIDSSSTNKGLELQDLNQVEMKSNTSVSIDNNAPQVNLPVEGFDLKTYISNIEVKIIEEALNNSGGVIAHAAKILGLRRTTLAEKMRKYHIEKCPEQMGYGSC